MQSISDPSRHGRSHFQRLVNANEIVMHKVQAQHMNVVFQLLGKSVGQPREPTHSHPHGEVLALHVGRADVTHIRVTFDTAFLDAGAFGM